MLQRLSLQRRVKNTRRALVRAFGEVYNNHGLAYAGALSYYFFFSLFPLMILLASVMAYLPFPDLFLSGLLFLERFTPAEGMVVIRGILRDVLTQGRPELLTLGILGTIWTGSTGFAALMEALNIAYDAPETRPYWRTRLIAVGLMLIIGTLTISALVATVLGPKFGEWLTQRLGVDPYFAAVWPTLRWTVMILGVILAVELLFYWAPNVKQRFRNTLPGAIIAVLGWIGASQLLRLYIENFANYTATYGALGAVIILLTWLYVTALIMIYGAEVNSELIKINREPPLELKEPCEEPLEVAA